jgi:5'-nucleotidase
MPVAGSLAALAGAAALCGNGPLDILLTNDDGADAVGIRALRAQLEAAGHRVILAAPARNASGSSMSFSWGAVRVTRDPADPLSFAIDATPAASVVLAVTALYPQGRRPDLVISGINHGSNTGALLTLSGTVGGALAGTLLLDPPVPGIAVNAARLDATQPVDAPANRAQFETVAAHLVRLVGATRGWFCDGEAVVRARTALNVNYPARPVAQIAGVVTASQGTGTDLRITFEPSGDGEYRARPSRLAPPDERGSDDHWLALGYVTVTPLSGAIGATDVPRRALQRRMRKL